MALRSPSPETAGSRRPKDIALAKFFLFCMVMIMFCVLLYIPLYNKANNLMSKGAVVACWTIHTNRDPKLYVQPNNVTTIHEPKHICPPHTRNKKNNLFLLIIVCSSTTHFNSRIAIRETWGHYKTYLQLSKIYKKSREKYKNYNYTFDLFPLYNSFNSSEKNDYNYDYESNVMKIPPTGYEDNNNLDKALNASRKCKHFPKDYDTVIDGDPDFKLLFLLGLPSNDYNTDVQNKIEKEVQEYGDVLQEGFIDSYYNLTLKSMMMLKWITNKCNESVRYILKTDDDMYINVPALITNLRNRSQEHELKHPGTKEYLLIGVLICGARPIADIHNKWYNPPYMYSESVYPRYLSGTGYALSSPTAAALYRAALHQNYFHLEDVYITGICALRAVPTVRPRGDAMFSFTLPPLRSVCLTHALVTTHRLPLAALALIVQALLDPDKVDE